MSRSSTALTVAALVALAAFALTMKHVDFSSDTKAKPSEASQLGNGDLDVRVVIREDLRPATVAGIYKDGVVTIDLEGVSAKARDRFDAASFTLRCVAARDTAPGRAAAVTFAGYITKDLAITPAAMQRTFASDGGFCSLSEEGSSDQLLQLVFTSTAVKP